MLHVQEKKVHSFCGLLQHAIVCCTDWSLHACISFLWGNAAVLRHNSVLTHLSSCKKATIFRLRVVDWSVLACYSPAFCEVETTLYLHFVTGRKGLPAVGAGVAAVRCAMVPVLPTCNFSVALEDCFSHSLLQGYVLRSMLALLEFFVRTSSPTVFVHVAALVPKLLLLDLTLSLSLFCCLYLLSPPLLSPSLFCLPSLGYPCGMLTQSSTQMLSNSLLLSEV